MGLEGTAVGVGPCQGSRPEMIKGGRRNGMGAPRSSLSTEAWLYLGPAAQKRRASFPRGTRSPQEAPLLHALHVGHPSFSAWIAHVKRCWTPGAILSNPHNNSHFCFFKLWREKKVYLCCLASCSDHQRQTSALPVCSLSSNSAVGPAGPRHSCHCSDAAVF